MVLQKQNHLIICLPFAVLTSDCGRDGKDPPPPTEEDDEDDLAFLKELQEQAEAQRMEDEKLGATVDYSAAKGKKEATDNKSGATQSKTDLDEEDDDADL